MDQLKLNILLIGQSQLNNLLIDQSQLSISYLEELWQGSLNGSNAVGSNSAGEECDGDPGDGDNLHQWNTRLCVVLNIRKLETKKIESSKNVRYC